MKDFSIRKLDTDVSFDGGRVREQKSVISLKYLFSNF